MDHNFTFWKFLEHSGGSKSATRFCNPIHPWIQSLTLPNVRKLEAFMEMAPKKQYKSNAKRITQNCSTILKMTPYFYGKCISHICFRIFWPKYRKKTNSNFPFSNYHFLRKKCEIFWVASFFFTWKFLNISCRDTNLWVWWLRFLRSRIWKRKHKRKFYEHYLDS